MQGKLVVITGATSGIGLACAELLAEKGYDLILTGRREERLKEIASRLNTKVQTSAFDISDRQSVSVALGQLDLTNLSGLINNAGLAVGTQTMQTANIDDWEKMIDTNVKGLLYVTRETLPHLIKNKGHVVNIGSVAGRWVYPGGGVYCSTKFAVRALSEGLRMDTMGKNLRVTNIEPGMVETEFSEVRFSGDKEKAKSVYRDMSPLKGRDIAEAVWWSLERPAHVNIQEMVIYPTDQVGVGNHYTARHT